MPKAWVRRHKRDYYYRKAKKENYRSRASYKLLQAVEKYRFIKPNDVIVDLGAAPGGWLQIARELVGEKGFVLGVDITEIAPLGYDNVVTMKADIRNAETTRKIKAVLPRPADVVISDVSPKVSGVWETDHARQIDLAETSLNVAKSVLRWGGNFFVKAFQGDLLRRFLNETRREFDVVRVIKPKASRKESAELYVLGLGLASRS